MPATGSEYGCYNIYRFGEYKMHIPYYGEDSACESKPIKQSSKNKLAAFVAAVCLAVTGHPASADDYKFDSIKVKHPSVEIIEVKETLKAKYALEEVLVTAKDIRDLVKPTVQVFNLRVGLDNKVLVHVYDKKTDTWKFVGTEPSIVLN
jgi:hypothetical protein